MATVLSEQAAALDALASAWWTKFAVNPFTATHSESAPYVVAQQDRQIIFFTDDEDEFGTGILTEEGEIDSYGLVGDLIERFAIAKIETEPNLHKWWDESKTTPHQTRTWTGLAMSRLLC